MRPSLPRSSVGLVAAILMSAAVATSCGGAAPRPTTEAEGPGTAPAGLPGPSVDAATARPSTVVVEGAASPSALLAEADGSFLYAERLTGSVRRVGADGVLQAQPVASVPVTAAEDDQRGLLSLVRDGGGRLLATWTDKGTGRITIGQIDGDEPRVIWDGPPSATLANGGHLALLPDGDLVVGIGDLLQDRTLERDPAAPNRKVLRIDADGPRTQRPTVLSSGWNNPFALTTTAAGAIWVADNTGADGPERIGRGEQPATDAVALGGPGAGEVVPSALIELGPDRLGMCTYKSRDLREIRTDTGRARVTGRVLAAPCGVAAARLPDGRVVTATPDQVLVTREAV
jgi:glucose/arabinose dehydrogenase